MNLTDYINVIGNAGVYTIVPLPDFAPVKLPPYIHGFFSQGYDRL